MNTQKQPELMHIRTRVFAFAALAAMALVLASCSSDPILATIESEAKLSDATILGTVTSMVVSKNTAGSKDLYCTNGYIYMRASGSGSWNTIELPSTTVRCFALATDALDGTGSLYALFVQTESWETFDSLQKYDGTNWTKVIGLSTVSKIGSGNGRIYAFVNDGTNDAPSYSAYAIAAGDTTIPTTTIATKLDLPVGTAGDYVATSTAVYYRSGSTLTKLTYSGLSGIEGITTNPDGTCAYIANNSNVYKLNETAVASTATLNDITSPVSDIAYLDTTGTDFVLVANAEGYVEVPVAADGTMATASQIPGSTSTSSISKSAYSQYKSSIAIYVVQNIFPVSLVAPTENGYVIYAGITYTSYDGLWAYYPVTRPQWNRE